MPFYQIENTIIQSPQFKKFGKIRLRSKLLLGLTYDLGFRIKVASNFAQSWVHKTGLILNSADFHSWNWRIPRFNENMTQHCGAFQGLIRTWLNIEPLSPLKPTDMSVLSSLGLTQLVKFKISQLSIKSHKLSVIRVGS